MIPGTDKLMCVSPRTRGATIATRRRGARISSCILYGRLHHAGVLSSEAKTAAADAARVKDPKA